MAKAAKKGIKTRKQKQPPNTLVEAGHTTGTERDYEAEGAYDTMLRAEQHRGNPPLMKRVRAHASKQSKAHSALMKRLEGKSL
jgi:hypothetical protein